MPYDRPLRTRLSKDTYRRLEREAKKRGLNVSELTRLILDGYFERRNVDAAIEELINVIMGDPEIQKAIKKKLKK